MKKNTANKQDGLLFLMNRALKEFNGYVSRIRNPRNRFHGLFQDTRSYSSFNQFKEVFKTAWFCQCHIAGQY